MRQMRIVTYLLENPCEVRSQTTRSELEDNQLTESETFKPLGPTFLLVQVERKKESTKSWTI